MLAFNLGVFFRNLQGAEVTFAAQNEQCQVNFRGGVEKLLEQKDLTHHLSVTLTSGDLSCRIVFEDEPEGEGPEKAEVEVKLFHAREEGEVLLLQTTFRFEEVTIKPTSTEDDSSDTGPLTA